MRQALRAVDTMRTGRSVELAAAGEATGKVGIRIVRHHARSRVVGHHCVRVEERRAAAHGADLSKLSTLSVSNVGKIVGEWRMRAPSRRTHTVPIWEEWRRRAGGWGHSRRWGHASHHIARATSGVMARL